MDKKIRIFEDVSKDIINKFFKKEEFKKAYFSFFFDEDKNNKESLIKQNKYYEFDDIDIIIFKKIQTMMIKSYDFSIDIIRKYTLIVKNIEKYDIDILNLIFKSIELQFEIIKYKNTKNIVDSINELEKFIIENLHYNIQDYIDLLNKFYTNKNYKPLLTNIFVMIYNYSLFYSIENLKKKTFIKN
jgi:hypothetical protein